jgi:hypothetical protein
MHLEYWRRKHINTNGISRRHEQITYTESGFMRSESETMRLWERMSGWVGCMWPVCLIGDAGISLSGLRLNRQWNTFHYRLIEGTDSEDSFHCRFFSKTGSNVPDTQLFECMPAAINVIMYAALLLVTCYVNETLILRSFFKKNINPQRLPS